MPDVPVAPVRTVEQAPASSARVDESAPIEAFGGGPSAAAATGAASDLATQARDMANDQVIRTNQIAVNQGLSQLKARATDIQISAGKMLGQNAFAAPDYVEQQWKQAQKDIGDTLTNDAQKAQLSMHANDLYDSLYKTTQEHVSQQGQAWDDKTTSSLIDNSKTRAVVNATDPELVAKEVETQQAALNDWAKRKGIPAKNADGSPNEIYQSHVKDVLSQTYAAVISEQLDANQIQSASDYFDKNKESMSAVDIQHIEKRLESSKDVALSMSVYNDVKGMKLADGNPDQAKMENYVRNLPDLTDERRLKIENFVNAKAMEDRRNLMARQNADEDSFRNNLVDAKKQGQTLEQALTLPAKFSHSDYDQALKENYVREMWSTAEQKTDMPTKVALMDAIDQGTATQDQIDKAYYQDKTLSGADWAAARGKYRTTVIDGKSPEMQRGNEQVKAIAKQRFGSDAEGMAEFISNVKSDSQGKTPEEMVKIATDKLKQDDSTATRFWNWIPGIGGATIPGFSGQPQYETDEAKRAADSLTIGRFQQDLGADTVKAIGIGAVRTGAKDSNGQPLGAAAAVDGISVAFGGYDKMKPGTPVYNAMQSLSKAGKVVTPDSIKRVLTNYPTGIFTPPASAPGPSGIIKIPRGRR